MDKAGELEAHWRGHVDAWRASGVSQKEQRRACGRRLPRCTLPGYVDTLASVPVQSRYTAL